MQNLAQYHTKSHTLKPCWMLTVIGGITITLSLALRSAADRGDLAPAALPEISNVAEMRTTLHQLAQMEDDQKFVAAYYALLARHHVAPILRHGNRLPIAADAQLLWRPEGALALRHRDGTTMECGEHDFVRGITANGQWVPLQDTTIRALDALVVRSENLLIIIDLNQQTVGFATCGPVPDANR